MFASTDMQIINHSFRWKTETLEDYNDIFSFSYGAAINFLRRFSFFPWYYLHVLSQPDVNATFRFTFVKPVLHDVDLLIVTRVVGHFGEIDSVLLRNQTELLPHQVAECSDYGFFFTERSAGWHWYVFDGQSVNEGLVCWNWHECCAGGGYKYLG